LLKTLDPQLVAFRNDVLSGLAAPIPAIPARWLYDHRGSELFDEITKLPSYYPTRTETAIFHEIMPEVAARVPKGAVVVEFGAGSQTKTPILLEAIAPAAYVPVDISGDYLEQSAAELQQRFPKVEVIPVVADFTRPFSLPGGIDHLPKVGGQHRLLSVLDGALGPANSSHDGPYPGIFGGRLESGELMGLRDRGNPPRQSADPSAFRQRGEIEAYGLGRRGQRA